LLLSLLEPLPEVLLPVPLEVPEPEPLTVPEPLPVPEPLVGESHSFHPALFSGGLQRNFAQYLLRRQESPRSGFSCLFEAV
jgi:hypothetical protein